MKIEQIRNATLRIEYGGQNFLVDPWLADKGAMGSFAEIPGMQMADTTNLYVKMPMCKLPKSIEEILSGIDAYLLTHLHPDHFDMDPVTGKGGASLDKNIPIFVQNQDEKNFMQNSGFKEIHCFSAAGTSFGEVTITKTDAVHGTKKPCGPACGLILQHPKEKTIYIAGDTIWCDSVKETLIRYQPEIIIVNACAAAFAEYGRLIMDEQDILEVHKACPSAILIASHMDTVAHATITRKTLREKLAIMGIENDVLIPENGESYQL